MNRVHVVPLNCYLDGRFVGPDGNTDVIDGEAGYPQCGRCVREHRGVHLIAVSCLTVHRADLSDDQIQRLEQEAARREQGEGE